MKALFLILLPLLAVPAAAWNTGMEAGLTWPYAGTAVAGRPILSLSGFSGTVSPVPGYREYGFLAMLPMGAIEAENLPANGTQRVSETAGLYAGQLFLPFDGLVRPGFDLGWIWEKRSAALTEGTLRSDSGFGVYYAFKVQFSCLTFMASNLGLGGGINFSL
jgi:hypothetical protein